MSFARPSTISSGESPEVLLALRNAIVCRVAARAAQMPAPSQSTAGRSAPDSPSGTTSVRISAATAKRRRQDVSLWTPPVRLRPLNTTQWRATFATFARHDVSRRGGRRRGRLESLPFTQPSRLRAAIVPSRLAAQARPPARHRAARAAPSRTAPPRRASSSDAVRLSSRAEISSRFSCSSFVNTRHAGVVQRRSSSRCPTARSDRRCRRLAEGALDAAASCQGPLAYGPTPVQFGYRLRATRVPRRSARRCGLSPWPVIVRIAPRGRTVGGAARRTTLEGRQTSSSLPALPRPALASRSGLPAARVAAAHHARLALARLLASSSAAPAPTDDAAARFPRVHDAAVLLDRLVVDSVTVTTGVRVLS